MNDEELRELDYYEAYAVKCRNTDDDTLNLSAEHWAKCHVENVKDKRDDLILWSARHLMIVVNEQRRRAVKRRTEGR